MAAGKGIALVVLLGTTLAAGCTGGRDESALNTLATRLEQLERRIAAADNRAELTLLTQRLSGIEARLAAVEAQGAVAECQDSSTPPANVNRPGDSVQSPPIRAAAPLERSQRFKGVAEEDRARLARTREQFRDNPDAVARRQAMQEVHAWRRAQVNGMRLRDNAGEDK